MPNLREQWRRLARIVSAVTGVVVAVAFFLGDYPQKKLLLPALVALGFLLILYRKVSAREWFSDFCDRNYFILAFLLIIVGALLRFAWAVGSGVKQTSDFAGWANEAAQMFESHANLHLMKPQGPSFVGLFIYGLIGRVSETAVLGFIALLSTIQIWLVLLCSKRWFGAFPSLFTGLLMVFWPENILYVNLFGNEVYLSILAFLGFYLLVCLRGQYLTTRYLLVSGMAGLVFGIGQYFRGTAALLMFGMAIVLLLDLNGLRKTLAFSIGFFIAASPYIYLNYSQYGIFSVAPSQFSGYTLFIGTNLKSNGGYYADFGQEIDTEYQIVRRSPSFVHLPEAVAKNKLAGQIAVSRLVENPWEYLRLGLTYKLPVFLLEPAGLAWSLEGSILETQAPKLIRWLDSWSRFFHLFIMSFVCFAFLAAAIRPLPESARVLFPIGLFTLALAGLHTVAEIQAKYHHVLSGFWVLSAAPALAYLRKGRQEINL